MYSKSVAKYENHITGTLTVGLTKNKKKILCGPLSYTFLVEQSPIHTLSNIKKINQEDMYRISKSFIYFTWYTDASISLNIHLVMLLNHENAK